MKRKSKSKKSKKSGSIKMNRNVFVGVSILVVVALLIFVSVMFNFGNSSKTGSVVASVNGYEITQTELSLLQQSAIQQGQQLDNKTALEQAINQRLLLQEADAEGYSFSLEEAESYLEQQVKLQGLTIADVKSQLKEQGESYDEALNYYAEQLTIQKYIAETIEVPEVNISEAEEYYEKNKEQLFAGNEAPSFEEISSQLISYIQSQKQQQEITELILELREEADIVYN